MKKGLVIGLLCSLCFIVGARSAPPPQSWSGSAIVYTVAPTVLETQCGSAPAPGFSTCQWGGGVDYWTGTAWKTFIPIPAATAAITGVTVNGTAVAPNNGVVALKIPTRLTINPVTPTGTIQ